MIEQIIYWPCDYIKNQFAEKYPPLSRKINKKHQAVIPSYARRWRENGLGWPRKVPGRTCARWRDFGEQRLRKSMDPRTRYLYSDIISGVWMYLVNDIIIFYLYNIYHIYIYIYMVFWMVFSCICIWCILSSCMQHIGKQPWYPDQVQPCPKWETTWSAFVDELGHSSRHFHHDTHEIHALA